MIPRVGARDESGFSLLEALVSLAVVLAVLSAVARLVDPAQRALQAEPEIADMQQRLRSATSTLIRELMMAGAGTAWGRNAGPLTSFLAPVLPFRQGLRLPDPPGSFKADAITLLYVPETSLQATIAQPLPAQSGDVAVNTGVGCPLLDAVCGLSTGMNVLVYDDVSYDQFTVTGIQAPSLHLQHDFRDTARIYPSGTKIVQVVSRTYYLKSDNATSTYQMIYYDGASGNDVPVIDHVVALQFEYYGDPQPPMMRKALTEPLGPWTTYGPKPPLPDVQTTGYAPGENCAFVNNGTTTPAPRLEVLGPLTALVKLTAAQLTDGPWCPDDASPNRFDADLLRIRMIVITLRVQSAVDALRGPAGVLFTHAGSASDGNRFVPDAQVRVDISPRNLGLGR